MSKFKINGEQCLEVIKLYQQGLTMQKIANMFSVGSTTIRSILKKNNIKSRKFFDYIEKFPPEKEAEMITLYNQGLTAQKLSELFGLSNTTIKNKLRKNKVKTRELADYIKIFSPEEELEVIELYKKDHLMSSLAKKFKCSISVIDNILNKHNITKKDKSLFSKKLSIEQEKEIIEFYIKGETIKKLAKKYKVSIITISKALKRNNIETRRLFIKKIFPEQENKVVELYLKSWTPKDIAKEFGIAQSSIVRILKDKEIYEPIRNRKKINSKIFSDQHITRIILLYEKGLSLAKIGSKYGVQPQTIRRLLDSQNIKIKTSLETTQKLNSDDRSKVLKLYADDIPISKIAKSLNVSASSIKRVLKNNKVEIKKKGFYQIKITKENEEEIVKLFKSGFTKRKIAELFNVSSTTISKTLEKNDIKPVKKTKQI